MTDKEIAEKRKELRALMEKLEIGGEWWPQGYVIHSDHLDEVWDFIAKLVEEAERGQFGKARLIGEPFRETKKEHKHNWVMISHESFPFPQFTCPDCKIPDWIYEGREAIGA